MKKLLLVLALIFSGFIAFCSSPKVCLVLDNKVVKNYLCDFDVDIITNKIDVSEKTVNEYDERIFELLSKENKADFLLIPVVETISDCYYLKLSLFDCSTKTYTVLLQRADLIYSDFNDEDLSVLDSHFTRIKEKQESSSSSIIYKNLLIESNVDATVKVNGKIIGNTPITLDEYSLPLVLTFSSEGYSDRVEIINGEINNLKVELKPIWMAEEESYKKSKKNFYLGFARTLVLIGVRAGLQNITYNSNTNTKKTVDIVSLSLLGLSAADNIFDLYKFKQHATYITP